jgi:hypothetical protein
VGLGVQGGAQDLAGEQVADLNGDVLQLREACAPGHAVGTKGVAEDVFGGHLEGGSQRMQQLRYVLASHGFAPQGVTANRFLDFRWGL